MFPRDLFVRTPAAHGFDRGASETVIVSADCGNGCDDLVVHRILAAASQQRARTMGEFGLVVRPYLNAGYQREVTEAHRRYFR
jgi:hypothetical protein